MPERFEHDVLIIGSGAAGLALALQLPSHCRIAVLSKGTLTQGSTFRAQGGMAAVLDSNDTVESHVADTMKAGAGLCQRDVVEFVVGHSAGVVDWLVQQGVIFDKRDDHHGDEYHLTMEGGHSQRRVIHAADATGKAISEVLVENTLARGNIDIFTNRVAVDVIVAGGRCQGAYILDHQAGSVQLFQSSFVVLATGGASKAYLYTR